MQPTVLVGFKPIIKLSLLLLKNVALLLLFLSVTYTKVVYKNASERSELPCPGHVRKGKVHRQYFTTDAAEGSNR